MPKYIWIANEENEDPATAWSFVDTTDEDRKKHYTRYVLDPEGE